MKKFFDKSLLTLGEGRTKLSLFALTIPIFLENVGVQLIGIIQAALSARYAEGFFVTPLNVASSTVGFINNVSAMIPTGMAIILSIYLGKQREDDCKKIIGTALFSLMILRLTLYGIAFFMAEPIFSLQGLATEENAAMLKPAVTYFRGLCVINVFTAISVVFSGALRCYGVAKVGFMASIATSVVALALTYAAFYMLKVPEYQAIGWFIGVAAVATVAGLTVNVVGFVRRKIPINLGIDGVLLKKMLKVGFPAAVSMIMYSFSTVIAGSICVYMSNDMYLARAYVSGIVYFTNIFGYALGQANSIMVGRGCGMGDFTFVDASFKQNLKITLLSNFVLSLVIAALGVPLLKIYTDSAAVLAIGSALFFIDIVVEQGRGMNHLGQFGLNATGDTVYTTVVSVVSCLACSIGLGYTLGVAFSLGVYGLWIAAAVDELFRGVLYLIRWNKGRWKAGFGKEKELVA